VFAAVSDESRIKNTQAKRTGNIKRYQGLSIGRPTSISSATRGGDAARKPTARIPTSPHAWDWRGGRTTGPADSRYRKLLACAKHFAVHSGPEWNRHSFNIEDLPARDLWETYLPAFKSLVQEGGVAEVMCAYQRFDGQPCCGSRQLLQQIPARGVGLQGMS
jgi:beta-glucosidase